MNTGRRESGTCSQRSVVRWTLTTKIFLMACGLLVLATTAHAAVDEESQFVLNTFSFLIWGALAGIIVVGPRVGKFRSNGSAKVTPPSNVPLVTLGVLILWFGWLGFNGGSQLAIAGVADAVAMSNVLANTNLAAAAGVVTALAAARPLFGRIDLLIILNGAIGGLVAITAGPDITTPLWAVIIGALGGLVCAAGTKLLEVMKVDDVVGAVPAHLFAGIWGTLAVCIAAGGNLGVQLLGILAVGVFVFGISWLTWMGLKFAMGVRVSPPVEEVGQDAMELGIEAYPEFVLMPDPDHVGELRNDSGGN